MSDKGKMANMIEMSHHQNSWQQTGLDHMIGLERNIKTVFDDEHDSEFFTASQQKIFCYYKYKYSINVIILQV